MRFGTTLLCSALVLALASPARAGIRYVNAALGSGANDGTSWADAFQGSNGLQAALAAAVAGDQIWVAQGSYEPTPGTDRLVSFELRNGIEIYGGFAGGETALGQRDFVAHVTTLTGDLAGNDGANQFGENSCHVLHALGTEANAILDGFTVRGGNGNVSTGLHVAGGGILCEGGSSPTLRNCILAQNRCTSSGGAGCMWNASPNFVDCRFESNSAGMDGGAILAYMAHPNFLRCIFSGNTAAARSSALHIVTNSSATLTNCVVWNNSAIGQGGAAITVGTGNTVIRQCIVAGNHSLMNPLAGIYASSPLHLANNIIYFNEGPGGGQGLENNVMGANCTWCCVQGIAPDALGNISANPLFVNIAAGDLHLSQFSPCADAGSNLYVPAGTTTDLDGNPRLADDPTVPDTGMGGAPVVDIGAYEVPNTLYSPFCAGDGSLATPCPCGNTGSPGRGCLNSEFFSPGALLVVTGTASPDTIVLTSSDMLPTSSCVFLQGSLQNPAGTSFGDGVRCVAGSLKRLYLKSAINGTASAPGPGDPSISARSAALGDPIAPGTQRYYQVYYRDSNLAFCPAPQGDSWNVSSGLILNW